MAKHTKHSPAQEYLQVRIVSFLTAIEILTNMALGLCTHSPSWVAWYDILEDNDMGRTEDTTSTMLSQRLYSTKRISLLSAQCKSKRSVRCRFYTRSSTRILSHRMHWWGPIPAATNYKGFPYFIVTPAFYSEFGYKQREFGQFGSAPTAECQTHCSE